MKLQTTLLRFLHGRLANYTVLFFIVISILAIIAGSFEEMVPYRTFLFSITYVSSFVFLLEYAARIMTAPTKRPHKHALKARMRYIFSFYGLVDFVAVLPCMLSYFYWDTAVIHVIILPYIFIIFKLIRHSRAFRLIGQALYSVKEELITAYTACFIVICFSAILMYLVERTAQPEAFNNIGNGIWWAIVTFTTTGYGDMYPITPLGKLLGGVISLIGITMLAIPTGIVSSSFIRIIQRREKGRQRREQRKKSSADNRSDRRSTPAGAKEGRHDFHPD